ncbi:MAG: hypothetical protein A2341_23625 [Deltaproteobacteria bacterium RIFOXYB12_FULL_58_9]|nr:MAG: hypothetical protein A2341_23625 [Deltaproteobacteria bacterium RIFOXYB12_FULL_58_9]
MSDATAAILIIGNEVLSGKVDDTNSPFLIKALRQRGIELVELRVIADVVDSIIDATRALSAATHLFTTGGIGPTHDDMTIEAIAEAFERRVVHHPQLLERLHHRYGEELSPARLKLAEVPDGSLLHVSDESPFMTIQFRNIFILPGVPSLMRSCFALVADDLGGSPIYSRAVYLDVAESDAAAAVAEVQTRHPGVSVGSYPRFDSAPYRVKITVDSRNLDEVLLAVTDLKNSLKIEWMVDIDGG